MPSKSLSPGIALSPDWALTGSSWCGTARSLRGLSLSAATINLHLSAIRRLADEAAESGWLSPELAIGIRRINGVKRLGRRIGNWLTRDQAQELRSWDPGVNARDALRLLQEGQKVTYEATKGPKGMQASNIQAA